MEAMNTPAEPIKPDDILTNARAKITWGDSAPSVRDYLIDHGVSAAEADAMIKQLVRERNAEIRAIGIRRILIGAPLVLVSTWFIWFVLADEHPSYSGSSSARDLGRGLGGAFLFGCFGLWKLIGGLMFLLRPQSDDESIADIEE